MVADLCTFMQHRSVYKQISSLHVLCSDVGLCCIAEIILQRPYSKRGLACESTFWLPACLSVCPGSARCLCCPLILERLPQKSLVITLPSLQTLLQKSEYEYGLDHVAGIRCCESNESPVKTDSPGWYTRVVVVNTDACGGA